MKIEKIQITNLKAVTEGSLDLKGATCIVTGPNDSGKSTLLKSIPDRIRFIRPDVVVTSGETEGSGTLTLTSGERFVWEYNVDGKDKLTYFTQDGLKSPVTKELGRRFFPASFDIDRFLQSSPKDQSKQLQAIVGLDFTDIDARYDKAYKERTARNLDSERFHVKLSAMLKVPEVKAVDLSELTSKKEAERARLNSLYLANKSANDKARLEWQDACRILQNEWNMSDIVNRDKVTKFNQEQYIKQREVQEVSDYMDNIVLAMSKRPDLSELTDISALQLHLASMPQVGTIRTYYPAPAPTLPPEPTYIKEMPDDSDLRAIDQAILEASETNTKAKAYTDYVAYVAQVEEAKKLAAQTDQLVQAVEQERRELIATANMPAGIEITPDGITVDGLPLSKDQISTSKLYIAALRIGSINLGSVRTLYFDASYLDNKNLKAVEEWAHQNDLQLLIEVPARDGSEIAYELIETL